MLLHHSSTFHIYTTVQKFGVTKTLFSKKSRFGQIGQKYSVDIVSVVNDYHTWKLLFFLIEYLHKQTEAHHQQTLLVLGSNGTLCLQMQV